MNDYVRCHTKWFICINKFNYYQEKPIGFRNMQLVRQINCADKRFKEVLLIIIKNKGFSND